MKRTPGALQHGVRLDQQAAEDDQVAPVVALAERGEERRRLPGGDRHRDGVVAAQQIGRRRAGCAACRAYAAAVVSGGT